MVSPLRARRASNPRTILMLSVAVIEASQKDSRSIVQYIAVQAISIDTGTTTRW